MKHFCTAGSRTGLVIAEPRIRRHYEHSRTFDWRISMKPLPPPRTFAEGQRTIYGLLAAAAGVFCGACAVAMVALLMWGGWSAAEEHSIVTIFGWSLAGFIVAMVVVIVGLLAGGPVGRFRFTASAQGAAIEADAGDKQ
jgi:hypothetical protein